MKNHKSKLRIKLAAIWQIIRGNQFTSITIKYTGLNGMEYRIHSSLPLLDTEIDAIAAELVPAAQTMHQIDYHERIIKEAKELIKC